MKARRAPLLGIALLSMAFGIWLGLVRLGWSLPPAAIDRPILHGPLMVCGFLGTLISLERAVALAAPWGYTGPILTAGGVVVSSLSTVSIGPLLVLAGAFGLIATTLMAWRRQPSLALATMLFGAGAWAMGSGWWLAGRPLSAFVSWWLACPVLTIAGERLELSRFLQPPVRVKVAFVAVIGAMAAGLAVSERWPIPGTRVVGVGLVSLSVWLARYDLARRTVRQRGLTRYMAVALLSGYVWLGAGGLLAAAQGISGPGLVYDATLHAVFLGFVMSMVFAHAPVIFPAILGRALPYRPACYAHLGVLHASLALRVAGDLVDPLGPWRVWGGLLNAAAIAVFVANTARALAAGSTSKRGRYAGKPAPKP